VSVEDGLDELWLGVKCQSNTEIAGSPRNVLRYSVTDEFHGGRALNGLGAPPGYRTQSNSECREMLRGSETVGAKLHCREGNSPDRRLRSQSVAKCTRMWGGLKQPGCWLRSSHH